jgi:DsbC/DsbD-like thiol-disulfide interchange protein
MKNHQIDHTTSFMKNFILVIATAILAVVGQVSFANVAPAAQDAVEPPNVVIKMEKAQGKPGAQLKGTFTMTIAEGWHCYPNPPSDPYCVPVYLSSATEGFKMVKVNYPKGLIDPESGEKEIYLATVVIPFTVELPASKGSYDFKIAMRYQQCDSFVCLPPSDLVSTVKVVVK